MNENKIFPNEEEEDELGKQEDIDVQSDDLNQTDYAADRENSADAQEQQDEEGEEEGEEDEE